MARLPTKLLSIISSLLLVGSIFTFIPGINSILVFQDATAISKEDNTVTPLQKAIHERIDNDANSSKPHPNAVFESEVSKDGNKAFVKAKTTLDFVGPKDAGKNKWDDIIVDKSSGVSKDSAKPQNLTKDLIEKYPQVYGDGKYAYGKEPRRYTIEETYVVTLPDSHSTEIISSAAAVTTTDAYVVMGFTATGNFDYSRHDELSVLGITIAELTTEFSAEIDYGLRLPAKVTIKGPNTMLSAEDYKLRTSLTPLDFDASDYELLGIPELEGKEFAAAAYYSLSLTGSVAGISFSREFENSIDLGKMCTDYAEKHDPDGADCENFVTPFGLDENGDPREFPIPTVFLPPKTTGLIIEEPGLAYVGIGLRLNPDLGSDKITAEWNAAGDSIGSGKVTYTSNSPKSFRFGPVQAGNFDPTDGQTNAQVTLDNYTYYFTRLMLTLGFNVQGGLNTFIFGWLEADTPYYDIYTFDLSTILGESALGQHDGTEGVTVEIPVTGDAVRPTSLTIENMQTAVPWGTSLKITGKLSEDSTTSAGVGGKPITFDGTGVISPSSVITNSDGSFTALITAPNSVGTGWTLQAHFAGDSAYAASDSIIKTFKTTKHKTTLTLKLSLSTVAHGDTYGIRGILKDSVTGDILTSRKITFVADPPIAINPVTTGTDGKYSASSLIAPGSAGTYHIHAHYAGNAMYSLSDSPVADLNVT